MNDRLAEVEGRLARALEELQTWREGGVTEELLRRNDGCIKVGKGCALVRADEYDALVAKAAAAPPEVSPPVFRDHPREVRLGAQARNAIAAIYRWADRAASRAVEDGRIDRGTMLAAMMIFRDAARALDPALAETLVPRLTEAAIAPPPQPEVFP